MDPPDARAALDRPSSRGSWTSCARGRRLRRRSRRPGGPAPEARRVQPLPAEGGPAHRRGAHPGRQPLHRAAQLRGVLPDARRRSRASRRTSTATARTSASRRVAAAIRCRPRRSAAIGPLYANAARAAARHAAGARARSRPTSRTSKCHTQPRAGPERRADRGRSVMRQIKKQRAVFVAILILLVLALGIGGYILSNQRFYLPAWVPVLGTDFYTVEAELPTAPGGRAGPGPDGEHRRRQGRRGRRGDARGRPRRRRDADPGRVRADLQGRHDAAAAEDRPEGHVPGARPRHGGRRRDARGRPRAGREHAARRERRRGAGAARRRHARLPAHPPERGRHRLRRRGHGRARALRADAPRRTCARPSSASSPPRATASASRGCWSSAASNISARDPQLPGAVDGAGAARPAARRPAWTPRTPTSRRSRRRRTSLREALELFPGALDQTERRS